MSADPENTREPTERELADLRLTVRRIGLAQRSIARAPSPRPPRTGPAPEWLVAWADAEDALTTASNRLIDALEAMPGEQNHA